METDHSAGVSKVVRSRCAIYRDEACVKPPVAARARAAATDTDKSRCAAQDQPKPPCANGGRRSLRFSRFVGARTTRFGSFPARFAQSSLTISQKWRQKQEQVLRSI